MSRWSTAPVARRARSCSRASNSTPRASSCALSRCLATSSTSGSSWIRIPAAWFPDAFRRIGSGASPMPPCTCPAVCTGRLLAKCSSRKLSSPTLSPRDLEAGTSHRGFLFSGIGCPCPLHPCWGDRAAPGSIPMHRASLCVRRRTCSPLVSSVAMYLPLMHMSAGRNITGNRSREGPSGIPLGSHSGQWRNTRNPQVRLRPLLALLGKPAYNFTVHHVADGRREICSLTGCRSRERGHDPGPAGTCLLDCGGATLGAAWPVGGCAAACG